MNDFDLISIGDSTIDVFMEIDLSDAEMACDVDDKECKISFEYGAKIPVHKLTRVAAVGNAANNAIGSARLGLNTAIYTVLGDDNNSAETREVFEKEGVATDFIITEQNKRSNFSTVINYNAERNIFVYHEDRNYKLPQLPPVPWAYITSVGKGHDSLHSEVVDYVKKNNVKLGFNPGSHQLRDKLDGLKPLLEATEALILNREEAHSLVDGDPYDTKGLIQKLKAAGPKIVVVTDGREGSFASYDGREVWHAGIPEQTPVIERTGCGDGYSTGFLAALAEEKDLQTAMIWGTMNATSVLEFIGAREGLLTQQKMQDFIRRYGEFAKPRMI